MWKATHLLFGYEHEPSIFFLVTSTLVSIIFVLLIFFLFASPPSLLLHLTILHQTAFVPAIGDSRLLPELMRLDLEACCTKNNHVTPLKPKPTLPEKTLLPNILFTGSICHLISIQSAPPWIVLTSALVNRTPGLPVVEQLV